MSFAFKRELLGLIEKDPLASDAERKRARLAVECRADGCVRFDDAAERLGVCKSILYRLVKKGELVGVKLTGKRPYGVTAESLAAFMERSKMPRKEQSAAAHGAKAQ